MARKNAPVLAEIKTLKTINGLPAAEFWKLNHRGPGNTACIIYWQSKELNRVINECNPTDSGIDLSMVEHISPIGWDNVILYGEYVLNRNLVKV